MTLILMGVFLILLLMGVPIAFGIAIAAMVAMIFGGNNIPVSIIAHKIVNGVNSFPLVAVPLFILAGSLAGETGVAGRLVKFARVLVGHIRGGLGHVNVLASMFFGGISGSAVADLASIGSLLIPAMREEGYSKEDAAAITASASTIGILIPPSIPMVIYGVTMGLSVGALFLAGFLPGVLVGLFLMVVVYLVARKKNLSKTERRASLREVWVAFKESFLALLLPVFLLGSIATGITTATEAGVIGVVYVLILGGLIYREFKFSKLFDIFTKAAINTAIPCFVVATTSLSAWLIAIERFPDLLYHTVSSITTNPFIILLLINFFLLIVGMFMDIIPAIILFAPILMPLATGVGISPIHFGAIMVINLGIGLVTPPVGNCLFLGCILSESKLMSLIRSVIPFLIADLLALAIVTYIPVVTTFLPALVLGK
jgi:tripartite ATP-independent transporter DctM subunit